MNSLFNQIVFFSKNFLLNLIDNKIKKGNYLAMPATHLDRRLKSQKIK